MCNNKPETDVPMVAFLFQCNAEEFRQWRNGILQGLDEIEALLQASRQFEVTDVVS